MGEKSEQKRRFIVETARRVFAEKGYKDVTMKDIVEACGISRGGLYLYFGSVEAVFLAVMEQEEEEADDIFSGTVSGDASAAEVLLIFLKEQKKEILQKKETLSMAMYEYYFASAASSAHNPMRGRFREAVRALTCLIRMGVENGEFYGVDAAAEANHIMLVLEGLRICAHTMGVTERMVDDVFLTLAGGIIPET